MKRNQQCCQLGRNQKNMVLQKSSAETFHERKRKTGPNAAARLLRESLRSGMRFINLEIMGDLDKSSFRETLGIKEWLKCI